MLLHYFDLLCCLASYIKDSTIRLSKQDELRLFENMLLKDLNALMNALVIAKLEREYSCYYHQLKYIPHYHIKHLINLGAPPKCLLNIKPLPSLGCLLDKSNRNLGNKGLSLSIRKHPTTPRVTASVD